LRRVKVLSVNFSHRVGDTSRFVEGCLVTYRTLLAHLEIGSDNGPLLKAAGDLAETFGARVIGVGGCQPIRVSSGDGYVTSQIIEEDNALIKSQLSEAEAAFREALATRAAGLDWRQEVSFGPIADYIARQARAADVILTAVRHNDPLFDHTRHTAVSDLVMQAGRPVLIVPAAAKGLALNHLMVGWKNTPETRRAVMDAVPLLAMAGRVTLAQIAAKDDLELARAGLTDVAAWLGRHGVSAQVLAEAQAGDDVRQLDALADAQGADVLIAGAYGHSRLREWALGGVTADLLLSARRFALVSH
jgi:nucleotide-binding universal stress UspA family protein